MTPKLRASVQRRDQITSITLSGTIDRGEPLMAVSELIGGGAVVVDLSAVDAIEPTGARDWEDWRARVERSGARLLLVGCSPAVVAQLNRRPEFGRAVEVRSVWAPYFCPACERDKLALVDVRALGVGDGSELPHSPSIECDACRGRLDFDDLECDYFQFVQSVAAPATVDDPKLEALLGPAAPTVRDRSEPAPGAPGASGAPAAPAAEIRPGGERSDERPAPASGLSGVGSAAAALAELEVLRTHTAPRPLAPARSRTAWLVLAAVLVVVATLLGVVMLKRR